MFWVIFRVISTFWKSPSWILILSRISEKKQVYEKIVWWVMAVWILFHFWLPFINGTALYLGPILNLNLKNRPFVQILFNFSNSFEFLFDIFFSQKNFGAVSFIFILPKIERTKVITFFPLPCLIFQTGEAVRGYL